MKRYALIALLTLLTGLPVFAAPPPQPALTLGAATLSGTTVSFPVTLTNVTGIDLAAIDAIINYNNFSSAFGLQMSGGNIVSATLGPAAVAAGKQLTSANPKNGELRIVVFGLSNTAIGTGVIATVTFDIVGAAPATGNESFSISPTATDPTGRIVLITGNSITFAPGIAQLAVSLTGSGSINSVPSGIACTVGSCSANYYPTSVVSLLPTPTSDSTFASWSGDCVGKGSCAVTMSANHTVTATFVVAKQVRVVGGTDYLTLAEAYHDPAVVDNSVIKSRVHTFTDGLLLDRSIKVNIMGGYDADFQNRAGDSTISGKLTIKAGTLLADMLIVQ
jgi:Divergent InlB B-repeat domain/Cohesin domain